MDISDRSFPQINEKHKSEENEKLKNQAKEFFNKSPNDEGTTDKSSPNLIIPSENRFVDKQQLVSIEREGLSSQESIFNLPKEDSKQPIKSNQPIGSLSKQDDELKKQIKNFFDTPNKEEEPIDNKPLEGLKKEPVKPGVGKFDVSDRFFSPIDERHKSEDDELKKQAREFFNKPARDGTTIVEKKEVDEFFRKKDEALGELFSDNIAGKANLFEHQSPIVPSFILNRMIFVLVNKIFDYNFSIFNLKRLKKKTSILTSKQQQIRTKQQIYSRTIYWKTLLGQLKAKRSKSK